MVTVEAEAVFANFGALFPDIDCSCCHHYRCCRCGANDHGEHGDLTVLVGGAVDAGWCTEVGQRKNDDEHHWIQQRF